VNQVKTRLQSLGLLDRTFAIATDEELSALVDALDEDHAGALVDIVGADTDAVHIRDAVSRGRLDGTMEGIAMVITDACLADCIEQLGDRYEHPSTEDLNEVLPGLIERHGIAAVRIMLASTVVGEAVAAPIIRDILKNDEVLKLPPAESRSVVPQLPTAEPADSAERAALKERRREAKARKQAEAQARREQSAKARKR
jgi:hypothetical protein